MILIAISVGYVVERLDRNLRARDVSAICAITDVIEHKPIILGPITLLYGG